jgi:signal transduction histidine kinase
MMYITLRLRMILLFCVVIGVFLAGTYVIVYNSFVREVRLGLDDRLLDAARPVIAAIVAHPGRQHFAGLEIEGQSLQLLGPDARVHEQSSGTAGFKINPEDLYQSTRPVFETVVTKEGSVRIAIIPTVVQGERRWFIIAESTANVDRVESLFRSKAFGLWTVSLLITTLIAVWYVNRSLSPIVDLSRHAAVLTMKASGSVQSDLGVSLPIVNPNDELGVLAANFNVLFDRVSTVVGQLRQFVSDAAHELRTPLAVVLGETQLLFSQPRTGDEYRAALVTITGELSTMTRIIEGLFTLSMADAGQLKIQSTRLFLDEVIQEASGLAMAAARQKKIQIEHTHLEEIEYFGDQVFLRQLFLILFDNAIKYSRPNTTIRVALRLVKDQPTAVVQDEGLGISAEDLPHVFERFYRAAPQPNEDARSGGLGLAIARAIIEANGGEISCRSELGKGSIFTIVFAAQRSGTQSKDNLEQSAFPTIAHADLNQDKDAPERSTVDLPGPL